MSLINEALKRASQVQKAQPPPPPTETSVLQPAVHVRRIDPFSWLLPIGVVLLCVVGAVLLWSGFKGSKTQPAQVAAVNPPAPVTPSAAAPSSPSSAVQQNPAPATTPVVPKADRVETTGPLLVSTPSETQAQAPSASLAPPPGPMQTISTPPSSPPPSSPEAPPRAPTPAVPVAVAQPQPTPKPAVLAAATPAVKAVEKTEPPSVKFPVLKLQGIYYRLSKPTVLINGQTLTVGDTIEGARVTRIERQGVILEMAGQQKELTLR